MHQAANSVHEIYFVMVLRVILFFYLFCFENIACHVIVKHIIVFNILCFNAAVSRLMDLTIC